MMVLEKEKDFLYLSIYERVKRHIHEGKLPKHSKLESIRQAATRNGVSTTTMEHAYNQLLIEGYIRSVPKKGYFVEAVPRTLRGEKSEHSTAKEEKGMPFNLSQTPDMFDVERFRKIMNEVLSMDKSIYEPCLSGGEWPLRKAIAAHLRSARDVVSVPEDIVVASGIQQLIIALGDMVASKARVAYLKPGFSRALHAFELRGFNLEGYDTVGELLKSNPDLIYLSPSNLYPSGEVMPINERLEIIKHANAHGTLLIEDDYNHLFRYNAYQIPTLYSLSSKDAVIYIGSFSRSTLISLRMSYMVVPKHLLKQYDLEIAQTVSKPDQLTMARFIEEGHYQRHLKRLARLSKRKNDSVKKALEPYMQDERFTIYGLESNMHFVIHFEDKKDVIKLTESLESLSMGYKTFGDERPMDILVPYSGIELTVLDGMFNELFKPFHTDKKC